MMPFNARAAGMNGWALQNPITKGASVAYEGVKNVIINGKNVAKTSTALITPVAKDVSKVLIRGVAGVALSVAIEGLLGSVDWVLDPENSMIRYKEKGDDKNCIINSDCPDSQFLWKGREANMTIPYFDNREDAENICKKYKPQGAGEFRSLSSFGIYSFMCAYNGDVGSSYWSRLENPAYDANAEPESKPEKSIPLDVVAAKVISNAEAGDSNAKVATTAAVADIVNDAQKDDAKARPIVNQLEANAKTEADNTATGETKPNTETGGTDLALEFPTFCGWAPQVCEAAQTVISFPQTLTNWWDSANQKADSWSKSVSEAWTAVKDWVKEPENKNTEIDIDNPTQNEPDTTISFSTACPAKIPLMFNWNGQTLDFSFDFSIWCESISTYVFPIVVALGSLHALYIVAGVRQDG